MADVTSMPTLDLAAGREVLIATLPIVLKGLGASSMEDLGWRQLNPNTLLIPVRAPGGADEFFLRLNFKTGREWPPSAQFVNPTTHAYDIALDREYLPKITSPQCQLHPDYRAGDGRTLQLICCSATFEFYDVLHGIGNADLIWQERDTFLVTVSAIQRAMASAYGGRWAPNGQ